MMFNGFLYHLGGCRGGEFCKKLLTIPLHGFRAETQVIRNLRGRHPISNPDKYG